MSANDRQVGGTHYNSKAGGMQHWDYVLECLDGKYLEGNLTKYVARHRKKNGVQDLYKAGHYLAKLRENMNLHGYVNRRVVAMSRVTRFCEDNGLNMQEAQIMLLAASWKTEHDLQRISSLLSSLIAAQTQADRELEGRKAGAGARKEADSLNTPLGIGTALRAEEAGRGYVAQDSEN